jgi:hypothetical protein
VAAGAEHVEGQRGFGTGGGDQLGEMIGAEEALAIERDKHVVDPHSGALRAGARSDRADHQAHPIR